MAKTFKTRILLKYDTYANWIQNNPVLKAGEVAIATIASGNTQQVNSVTPPQTLIKIGDGSTAYSLLPFSSALAADVYSWAKAEYATTYRINVNTNEKDEVVGYSLQQSSDNGKTWTDIADSVIHLDDIKTALASLQEATNSLREDLGVPTASAGDDTAFARIAALEEEVETYTQDIKDLKDNFDTNISTWVANNLDSNASQTANTENPLNLNIVLEDGKVTSISGSIEDVFAKKNVLDDLDFTEVTYENAVGTKVNVVEQVTQTDGKVSATGKTIEFNTALSDTNKAATMSDVNALLADINGSMHFIGVSSTDPEVSGATVDGVNSYESGDVVIYTKDGITTEYVYIGEVWYKLGDESIAQKLINGLNAEVSIADDSNANPLNITITQVNGKLTSVTGNIDDVFASKNVLDSLDYNGDYTAEELAVAAVNVVSKVVQENGLVSSEGVTLNFNTAVSESNKIATMADIPVESDIDISIGSDVTGEGDTVDVVAKLSSKNVSGHAITVPIATVPTVAGVENKITNALAGLDNGDTETADQWVTAAVQNDGVVTVTRSAIKINQLAENDEADYIIFDCGDSSHMVGA